MPDFRYRALTGTGQVISGVISASTEAEVARRIDYLGLVPIDEIVQQRVRSNRNFGFKFGRKIRDEDVTIFTLDLALLLKAGARLDEALELLAGDIDFGGLRLTVGRVRASVLAGESFADALGHHPDAFPPMYVALVRVAEASGTLEATLSVLARERLRSEGLRRKLADALRYPAFVFFAAFAVLVFFLMFVLPQFSALLQDFGAKLDPFVTTFMRLSELLVAHQEAFGLGAVLLLVGILIAARHPTIRAAILSRCCSLPFVRTIASYHRTALFSRNLDVLLSSGVSLTVTLRILADIMGRLGEGATWTATVERVRHGAKLADALAESGRLPAMAVRMLRLGEETGQLSAVAGRIAEFYETKLQRSLDRLVALIGPLAIITISVIVGGLIVSVMTSLLSVSQLVG
jgi:general secretion pathway protein F